MRLSLWLFLLISLSCASASAAPSLSWVFPAGGQRGTTVTLTVAGEDLEGVTGFFASGTGLKAEVLPASEPLRALLVTLKPGEKPAAPDAKRFRQFRIAIAPDAPLGRQEIRVYGPAGVSNARYFQVGDQPEVVEQEPNDESAGQWVQPPVVVNGRIQQDTDVDIFSFHGTKGERIVGEVYGERVLGMIDESWLKGYLELRDNPGHVLAANEGYDHWDPLIEYTLPADGDYSFAFRELTYRGAPSAVYRLAIGALPRATALFPPGGRRGSTVAVHFIGDNLGSDPVKEIAVPADAPLGAQEVRLHTPSGWTNALPFRIGDYPEVSEAEPNDDLAHAMPVPQPVTINGRLECDGDVDNYRFKVKKGQRIELEVWADRGHTPMDSYLRLLRINGSVAQENDDGIHERNVEVGSRDSRLERSFDADGEYVVQVRDLDERGGGNFVYRLTIAPSRPDFSVAATPDRPLIGTGGTAVIDLSLDRIDGFDGDVTVRVADLPPGFSATPAVIRKGQESGRLTVTAADGLPVQAVPLHVYGEATVDGHPERRLACATETYNIQGTGFTRELIGPVAGIGTPVPVALTVEPATLALKDGESGTIKVRARRQAGAAGEIAVHLLDLPAGLTAEPVKIPKDASEADLHLKVGPDAPAATVNLVAAGDTKVGKETFTANSPALGFTVTELPGFVIEIEPKELSVSAGETEDHRFTVKASRRGGFTDAIHLVWNLPATKLTLPAGQIDAGKSETKINFKLPKEIAPGAAEVRLVASAPVGGTVRTREVGVKLTVTAAKADAKE